MRHVHEIDVTFDEDAYIPTMFNDSDIDSDSSEHDDGENDTAEPSTTDAPLGTQTSHALRNPDKPVIPTRSRPRIQRSDAEKASRSINTVANRQNNKDFLEALNNLRETTHAALDEICDTYNKSTEKGRNLFFNRSQYSKASRKVRLDQAILHDKAKEVNEGVFRISHVWCESHVFMF